MCLWGFLMMGFSCFGEFLRFGMLFYQYNIQKSRFFQYVCIWMWNVSIFVLMWYTLVRYGVSYAWISYTWSLMFESFCAMCIGLIWDLNCEFWCILCKKYFAVNFAMNNLFCFFFNVLFHPYGSKFWQFLFICYFCVEC